MIANSRAGDHPPPQDLDAERSVLGCILREPGVAENLNGQFRPERFYCETNRLVAKAVADLLAGDRPVNLHSVALQVKEGDGADEEAIADRLFEVDALPEHAAFPHQLDYYIEIVNQKWRQREILYRATRAAAILRGPLPDEDEARKLMDLADLDEHAAHGPISIGDLMERFPDLDDVLIDGLIRRGETANIAGGTKAGKTWLMLGLALSIATGRHWLGQFACTPGKVLIIDNELKPATIQKRVRAVADAMAIDLDEYRDRIDVVYLRGRGIDLFGLRPTVRRAGTKYAAIILDSWYRALPPGMTENANEDQTRLYNLVDEYAEMTTAGWFLVKHPTKGGQGNKAVTDVGAGAGSQSRATDSHIVLREHDEEGAVVLEAAVRTFPPVVPFPIRWNFPVWLPADDLDPTALKGRKPAGQERQEKLDRDGRRTIIEALRQGPATMAGLRRLTGISRERCERLAGELERSEDVKSTPTTIRGNETREYQLANGEAR